MSDRTREPERMVRGIKPALSVFQHLEAEAGFCSLRTMTFDQDGALTVTVIELTRDEADDVRLALAEMLTESRAR